MRTSCLVLALSFLGAQALRAQAKLAGEGTCAKPDVTHAIPVGDRPGHSFVITQTKCTWTKPFEFAGDPTKSGTGVQFDEVSGNTARFHGYYLDLTARGDTVTYKYEGNSTMKSENEQSAGWNWTLAGGTGKLKNVRGRGSCKGASDRDGVYRFRCSGDYRVPNMSAGY